MLAFLIITPHNLLNLCITTGGSVDESHVWQLSTEERKQLIAASLRNRHEQAVKEFQKCVKEYNDTREFYEVPVECWGH